MTDDTSTEEIHKGKRGWDMDDPERDNDRIYSQTRPAHKRPKNMHMMVFEEFAYPSHYFGPYDIKWEGDSIHKTAKKLCDLCGEQRRSWYFWSAGLGRVFGTKSCHVYLCSACRDIVLNAPTTVRKCGKCGQREGMAHDQQLFSITLADGKERSRPYCVICLSEGAAREELKESVKRNRRRRRCKSV